MELSILIDMCPTGKDMPRWNTQQRNTQGHRKAVQGGPPWQQLLTKALPTAGLTEKGSYTDFCLFQNELSH